MRPAFKLFIRKYGAAPQRSWRRFIIGLGVFCIGLGGLILHPLTDAVWLDVLLIILMLVGFSIAMVGYVGIFASRFNRLL